jgi:hypothetical protein
MLVANSGLAQGIESRPEIALGAVRLLIASGERVRARVDRHDDGDEACEGLPERGEQSLLSGSAGSLFSGESGKGDEKHEEEEEEEDDRGTGPEPHWVGHGWTSSGDSASSPTWRKRSPLEVECGRREMERGLGRPLAYLEQS